MSVVFGWESTAVIQQRFLFVLFFFITDSFKQTIIALYGFTRVESSHQSQVNGSSVLIVLQTLGPSSHGRASISVGSTPNSLLRAWPWNSYSPAPMSLN